MLRAKRTFSPQFREEAVKLVIEGSRPIAAVARELGIGDGTLGNWVAAYRREHAGEEPALNVSERERPRQLERDARELRAVGLRPILDPDPGRSAPPDADGEHQKQDQQRPTAT